MLSAYVWSIEYIFYAMVSVDAVIVIRVIMWIVILSFFVSCLFMGIKIKIFFNKRLIESQALLVIGSQYTLLYAG